MATAFGAAVLVISIVLNIGLAFDAWLTRRTARRFERYMQQKEHARDRIARVLANHLWGRYLTTSAADAGKKEAYSYAAHSIKRFIVWEQDATELLREEEGRE